MVGVVPSGVGVPSLPLRHPQPLPPLGPAGLPEAAGVRLLLERGAITLDHLKYRASGQCIFPRSEPWGARAARCP